MGVKRAQVEKWVAGGIISQDQANKIQNSLESESAERASANWITGISTIGAILLGIAAIMFISANWDELTRLQKIFLAFLVTFLSLGLGYFLAFRRENFPKSGRVLMFLSALLYGGTLALISQVYHLSGPLAGFLFLWLIGVFPLTYLFRLSATLYLFIGLLFLMVASFISGATGFDESIIEGLIIQFPLIIVLGLFLFSIGSIHQLFPEWENYGRRYRMAGLKIAVFFLFWMTFGDILAEIAEATLNFQELRPELPLYTGLLAVATACLTGFSLLQNSLSRVKKTMLGGLFAITLLSMLAFLYFLPALPQDSNYHAQDVLPFTLFYNALFIGVLALILKEAYERNDLSLLNYGLLLVGVFIFGKYFQLFDDLLQGSAFFFVSGALLLGGGFALERFRHNLKKQWKK